MLELLEIAQFQFYFIIMNDQDQETKEQETQHLEGCGCKLCQKEREIQKIKQLKAKMHLQSNYKLCFNSSKSKSHVKDKKRQRRSESCLAATPYAYLDLQSTYGNQFVSKKGQTVTFRPKDNLSSPRNNGPMSTTYLQSYHSTLTPKPDEPMKSPEMPIGNGLLSFASESVYQKSYKPKNGLKPSLPIIQKQCLSLPKSLGPCQTTQRNSYIEYNPQKNQNIAIKPSANLVALPSFAHNFDTTYRNFFVSQAFRAHKKYDVDEIGNINWKLDRNNRKKVQKAEQFPL